MDRFGVRRQDAALGLRPAFAKAAVGKHVAARESAVMPAHSKKGRWWLGMECGDKANGRGTALVLDWGTVSNKAASCIIFDFRGQQDCIGPGGGLV